MISGTKVLKNIDNLIDRRPITAQIQLCNFCNNSCGFCRFAGIPVEKKRSITADEFKTYSNALLSLGVKGFILTGGEPTISQDFDLITDYLESNGLSYGVNTNFNVLKFIKPVFLKVSLDGYNAETYKEVRKADRYDRTIENLERYFKWKDQKRIKTNVGIQKLGLDPAECELFYEAHKNMPFDYMSFRPMESCNHEFYNDHDEKDVVKCLERLREKDKRVYINYKYYYVRECFEKCHANFLQIAVNPDGNVIYCCHKFKEIIGKVTDKDILEKMKNHKTDMSKCDVPCRMTGPNMLVRDMEIKTNDSMFI